MTTSAGTSDTGSTAAPADLIAIRAGATVPSFTYGIPLAMVANDIDAKHGLDIEYLPAGASSTNVIAAVMAGEYDVGFQASSTALDAMNQGSDIVFIGGALSNASILVVRPEVLEAAGITEGASLEDKVAALRGTTLASSPDGSGNNAALRRILTTYGLEPGVDVDVVGVNDPQAVVAGIDQGRFDGGFYGSGVMETNVVNGTGVILIHANDLELFQGYIGLGIVCKRDFLESNSVAVQRLVDALTDTMQQMHADQAALAAPIREQFFPDMDVEVFDVAFANALPAYPETPVFPKASFDRLVAIQTAGTGNDYSGLVYTEQVAPIAQG